jgi:hypothetical protein
LIFIPSNNETKWFSTGGCLWSIDGEKLGKPSLERHYPDLSAFFVNILGVRKLDLKLIINELQEIGDKVISVTHAENLLKSLKIYFASHPGEKPKLEDKALLSRVFPAYVPGHTQVQLLSAKEEFAIADRQSYFDALQPHVTILTFTVAEVQQLAPVFEWMGLATRNLSRVVDERTVVEGNDRLLDRELTKDLILKAGAFVRLVYPSAFSTTRSYKILINPTASRHILRVHWQPRPHRASICHFVNSGCTQLKISTPNSASNKTNKKFRFRSARAFFILTPRKIAISKYS